MILTEIDHVAIAVRDLEVAIADYREAFGAEVHHREVVESDHVEDKRGEGLHRVGYRVDDCATALQAMVDAGTTPIDLAPRPGSRGMTVAFVHPKGSFGTLIELVQE